MEEDARKFLERALESLASAEDDLSAGRFNSCANRCYFSCFQAAISALLRADIRPSDEWGHDFVRSRFAGVLINRRHLYPSTLKDALPDLFFLRQRADYVADGVSRTLAERALRRSRTFVRVVHERD